MLEPVLAAGDKLGVVVVTRRPEDTAGAVLSVFADPDTVITQVEEWSVDSRASKRSTRTKVRNHTEGPY